MRVFPLIPLLLSTMAVAQARAKVGEVVPEFELAPFQNGDGRQKISEFFGSPVLIEYWGNH